MGGLCRDGHILLKTRSANLTMTHTWLVKPKQQWMMYQTWTTTKLSLEDRVAMLTADQRRIFDIVQKHLLHEKEHKANQCHWPQTMESRLWLKRPLYGLAWAIAAPTGLVAFNVGGVTIHRLFQLPIEHEGKGAGYLSLLKTSEKVMKNTLRSVKMIAVDGYSMVSSLNFVYMNLRTVQRQWVVWLLLSLTYT